jgi:photosystem II stability/assembly factor-like uncharacterized protein
MRKRRFPRHLGWVEHHPVRTRAARPGWATDVFLAIVALCCASVMMSCDSTGSSANPQSPTPTPQASTQGPTATLPTQLTTPVAVQRVLDDPHRYMWQALMSPTGELMTWWSGDCNRKGRRCHAVYVLRDDEGNSAAFPLPRSASYSMLGATVDGFALERDVLRQHALHANGGFVVRPDGTRVEWSASHRPIRPSHDLVVLSRSAEHPRALDVTAATVGQLPTLPIHGHLTIASDGTWWLVGNHHHKWRVAWSRDGGETWAGRRLMGFSGSGGSASVAVGEGGHVLAQSTLFPGMIGPPPVQRLYVTTDNGDSWSRLRGVPFGSSPSFAASPDGRLLAVDAIGRLWRSDPAWSLFRRVHDVPQFAHLSGLAVAGAYVYIVEPGRSGKVFVSVDDGATWDRVPTR